MTKPGSPPAEKAWDPMSDDTLPLSKNSSMRIDNLTAFSRIARWFKLNVANSRWKIISLLVIMTYVPYSILTRLFAAPHAIKAGTHLLENTLDFHVAGPDLTKYTLTSDVNYKAPPTRAIAGEHFASHVLTADIPIKYHFHMGTAVLPPDLYNNSPASDYELPITSFDGSLQSGIPSGNVDTNNPAYQAWTNEQGVAGKNIMNTVPHGFPCELPVEGKTVHIVMNVESRADYQYLSGLRLLGLTGATVFTYVRTPTTGPCTSPDCGEEKMYSTGFKLKLPCGMNHVERVLLPNQGGRGSALAAHISATWDTPPDMLALLHSAEMNSVYTDCSVAVRRLRAFYRGLSPKAVPVMKEWATTMRTLNTCVPNHAEKVPATCCSAILCDNGRSSSDEPECPWEATGWTDIGKAQCQLRDRSDTTKWTILPDDVPHFYTNQFQILNKYKDEPSVYHLPITEEIPSQESIEAAHQAILAKPSEPFASSVFAQAPPIKLARRIGRGLQADPNKSKPKPKADDNEPQKPKLSPEEEKVLEAKRKKEEEERIVPFNEQEEARLVVPMGVLRSVTLEQSPWMSSTEPGVLGLIVRTSIEKFLPALTSYHSVFKEYVHTKSLADHKAPVHGYNLQFVMPGGLIQRAPRLFWDDLAHFLSSSAFMDETVEDRRLTETIMELYFAEFLDLNHKDLSEMWSYVEIDKEIGTEGHYPTCTDYTKIDINWT